MKNFLEKTGASSLGIAPKEGGDRKEACPMGGDIPSFSQCLPQPWEETRRTDSTAHSSYFGETLRRPIQAEGEGKETGRNRQGGNRWKDSLLSSWSFTIPTYSNYETRRNGGEGIVLKKKKDKVQKRSWDSSPTYSQPGDWTHRMCGTLFCCPCHLPSGDSCLVETILAFNHYGWECANMLCCCLFLLLPGGQEEKGGCLSFGCPPRALLGAGLFLGRWGANFYC